MKTNDTIFVKMIDTLESVFKQAVAEKDLTKTIYFRHILSNARTMVEDKKPVEDIIQYIEVMVKNHTKHGYDV